jgi:very-short-patch-repair endonuclease
MPPSQLLPVQLLGDPARVPRVLTWDEALALGFTPAAIRHRVEVGLWRRVLPRTYLTSDVLTWPDRLHAALAFAGPRALLSGAAALVTSGVRCVAAPLSVLVLVPTFGRSAGWVRIRRPEHAPSQENAPGPRRVTIARAVTDHCVEVRRLDDVRAVVAEVVRRRLTSVDELTAELRHAPRRGSAHLRDAIEEMSSGAWSSAEASTARLLRTNGIDGFEQNAVVTLRDGTLARPDFLWRQVRGILEIDSVEHHFAPRDLDDTMRRSLRLEAAGFSVIHRSPAAIRRDPEGFVNDVRLWLASLSTR